MLRLYMIISFREKLRQHKIIIILRKPAQASWKSTGDTGVKRLVTHCPGTSLPQHYRPPPKKTNKQITQTNNNRKKGRKVTVGRIKLINTSYNI